MASPWYDFRKYASYDAWTNDQPRCIAPTLYEENRRCKNPADCTQALSFKSRAENLVCGPERDAAIRDFILKLCCKDGTHRSKLSVNYNGVLSSLVDEYGKKMKSKGSVTVKREPQPSDMPLFKLAQKASFTPFTPRSNETVTVRKEILQKVDLKFVEEGTLYLASWPQSPDFVKIGYTSASAFDRVAKQAECFPGMRLYASFNFAFPEKIERLVHRELRAYRYKIEVCDACGGHSHIEWFKLTVLEAVKVMSDWFKLVHTESLYDATRELRDFWHFKVENTAGDITASKLLDSMSLKVSAIAEPKQIPTTAMTEAVKASEITELLNEIRMLREELKSARAPKVNSAQSILKTEPEAVMSKATVATPVDRPATKRPVEIKVKFPEIPALISLQPTAKAYTAPSKPLPVFEHPSEKVDELSTAAPLIFNHSASTNHSLHNEAKVNPVARFTAPEKPKGLFAIGQQTKSNVAQSTTTGTPQLFKFGTPLQLDKLNETSAAPETSKKSTPQKSVFGLTLTPPPTVDHKKSGADTFNAYKPTSQMNHQSKAASGTIPNPFSAPLSKDNSLVTPSKPPSGIFGLSPPATMFGKDSKPEPVRHAVSTPTQPRGSLFSAKPASFSFGSVAKTESTTVPSLTPSKSSSSSVLGTDFVSGTKNAPANEPVTFSTSTATQTSSNLFSNTPSVVRFGNPLKTESTAAPTSSSTKPGASIFPSIPSVFSFGSAPKTESVIAPACISIDPSGSSSQASNLASGTEDTTETKPSIFSNAASPKPAGSLFGVTAKTGSGTSFTAGSTATSIFASSKTESKTPAPLVSRKSPGNLFTLPLASASTNAPKTEPMKSTIFDQTAPSVNIPPKVLPVFQFKKDSEVDLARSSTAAPANLFGGTSSGTGHGSGSIFGSTSTSEPDPKKSSGSLFPTISPASTSGTDTDAAMKTSSTPSFSQGIGFGSATGNTPSFSFIPSNWFATGTIDAKDAQNAASVDEQNKVFQTPKDKSPNVSGLTSTLLSYRVNKGPQFHQNETRRETDIIKLDKQSSPLAGPFFTPLESAAVNGESTPTSISHQSMISSNREPILSATACQPDPAASIWKLSNKIFTPSMMTSSNNATHNSQAALHISTATSSTTETSEKTGNMDEIANTPGDSESDTSSHSIELSEPATLTDSSVTNRRQGSSSHVEKSTLTDDASPLLTFSGESKISLASESLISSPVNQAASDSRFGSKQDADAKPDLDPVLTSLAVDVQKALVGAEDVVKEKTNSIVEAIASTDVDPVLTFFNEFMLLLA